MPRSRPCRIASRLPERSVVEDELAVALGLRRRAAGLDRHRRRRDRRREVPCGVIRPRASGGRRAAWPCGARRGRARTGSLSVIARTRRHDAAGSPAIAAAPRSIPRRPAWPTIRLGAPLLEPVHGLAEPPRGRPAGRPPGLRHALDVGPPLPDRRQPRGPDPRGLADARRLGAGDGAGPDRADGRRQHVPRAGPDRQDGHDPRPHLGRPGDPRHRRRRGSRPSTRPSASRSATASRSGCAGSARRCRSCAGCSTASAPTATGPHYAAKAVRNDPPPLQERLPLLIGGGGEQVTLKLVARYGDANNVGGGIENVRRKEAILAPALRDRRPRPGRDRADDRPRHGHHPRLAGGGRAGPARDRSPRNGDADALGGPAGRDARGRRRAARPVPRARLPAPHRRVPVALRRGVDDPPRDRGPADRSSGTDRRLRLAGATSVGGPLAAASPRPWPGRGGARPWPGCRRSPCRTSAGGRSARCRRRPSGRCRCRRSGCAPAGRRSAR